MAAKLSDSGDRLSAPAIVLFGFLYFALAALTVRFTRFDGGVACIWVASAFAIAELGNRPLRQWGPYLIMGAIGGAVATAAFGLGGVAAIPFAIVNMGESAACALLLRRLTPQFGTFSSFADISGFFAIAGLLVPAAAAIPAALVATVVSETSFASNWLNYFAAHGLGAVAFVPLLTLLRNDDLPGWTAGLSRRTLAEAVLLAVGVAVVTVGVFAQSRMPLLFLPFVPMMVSVFRFGRLGAAMAIVMLTVIATFYTIRGLGPVSLLAGGTLEQAQFLQFYLATAVVILLPAAAELRRRKTLTAQLQESDALHRLILDRTGDIVMRLDVDGIVRYVSPSVLALGGYHPEELIGHHPIGLIAPEDVAGVTRVHARALASPNETFIIEYRGRRASGDFGWFETHTRATVDETGSTTGVVSIVREVTRRKEVERGLARDAATDPLTGLANRRAFDRSLQAKLASLCRGGRPACLVLFDLDHFKAINDCYGHLTGDDVLKNFAGLLRTMLRDSDTVGRFGGEEFIAIIDGADPVVARAICERVRVTFAASANHAADGRVVRATVSAGIVPLSTHATVNTAISSVDAALYLAKSTGRNRLALAA